MADFYCKVTDVGRAKLAGSTAGSPLQLAAMAVGDANGASYDPESAATALVNETYRGDLNSVTTAPDNPSWVLVEMVIPPATGGWYIRETGVYDTDGDLIAIGKYPPTYKPVLDDGTTVELAIRMVIEITESESVELVVDPDIVMASQTFVNNVQSTLQQQITNVTTSNPNMYFRGQF